MIVYMHLWSFLTLYQPMKHICVMSVLLFSHKSIRIYMEVIVLGTSAFYSVSASLRCFYLNRYGLVWLGKG